MSKEPWRKNYDFFLSQKEKLMVEHKSKFALVKDEKIIGIFETTEDADKYIEQKNLEPGTFLVQEITNRVECISRINIYG
ncbi:MAG: hypothetical protein ACR2M7_03985 [Bdellovibrionales bacterium]